MESTGLGRVLTGSGTAGPTYRFGQSNPFALPKVPSSGLGSKVDSTPGKGYIGFGLSSGLPVGTAWGDTPFPGSLAAARLMGQAGQDSTVGVPPTEKPSEIPSAPTDIGGTDDPGMAGASFGASGNDGVEVVPPTPVGFSEKPTEEVMDIGVKSGQKRKPVRVRARTKKVSKHQPEGAVNTLQLNHSSSGSDRTVVVSDTQSEVSVDDKGDDMEVPSTPFSEVWGPAAVTPDDRFSVEDYSYQRTGISPRIHRVQFAYFRKYPQPSDRLSNMGEFLRVISAVYEDLSSRLNEFETIKRRLEVLEASQAKPLFSQVSSLPVTGPLLPEPSVPLVSKSCGVSVPQQPVPSAPAKERSKVSLQPRPESPTVIVHPLGDSLTSSQALKHLLEEHIRPQQLGLRVLACLPATENGVLVRVHTAEMAVVLEQHINGHPELNGLCRARAPRRPNPRILVYDVPDLPGTREEQEATFLEKLSLSNSFPAGGVAVLFRKRGRGALQHWVLTLDPVISYCISKTNRLHWGLGSLKYRVFSEPIQCYRCLKFGHTQTCCRAPEVLCSRCPGSHSYKSCSETQSKCRNCCDYNKQNRSGPWLQVNHTAISRQCPIFLRACEEFKSRLSPVLYIKKEGGLA
ncbi:hypothetical protein AVEN_154028-1 [Araneus ventricosus]|uniref:CCHC-type domain-containing protein n=1 Tax=Araneus ventricosus TaxID=182803 RepID=A0A4Y2IK08_ARAVE|nr:hypothetical protein AVEN_154028-1 [Araneus ventricosus]